MQLCNHYKLQKHALCVFDMALYYHPKRQTSVSILEDNCKWINSPPFLCFYSHFHLIFINGQRRSIWCLSIVLIINYRETCSAGRKQTQPIEKKRMTLNSTCVYTFTYISLIKHYHVCMDVANIILNDIWIHIFLGII